MDSFVYFRPEPQHDAYQELPVGQKRSSRVGHRCLARPDFRVGDVDHRFINMLDGYRESGGLARAEEVLALFRRCDGPDVAVLARWIARRELICFEWQQQTWIPLFQIDRVHLCPDARLKAVFTELNRVYDQWEMGNWFALPNPWLAERTPVEAFPCDPCAVLDAARADRFVVAG